MKIKSIIDVITNSSSEVYVIKDSSLQDINQTLRKLGVSGIGKVIKFELPRYRVGKRENSPNHLGTKIIISVIFMPSWTKTILRV